MDSSNGLFTTLELLRTSYLSKEQIEAEGWIFEKESFGLYFKKKQYKLGLLQGTIKTEKESKFVSTVVVYREENVSSDCNIPPETKIIQYFQGNCKDINTFRYIMKLLCI